MAVGDKNCKECFGAGFVSKNGGFVKCESCFKVSINDLNKEENSLTEGELIDSLKSINAPEYVLDKDFDFKGERILRDRSIPKEERQSVELNTYINGLTELNEWSGTGVKLPYSYIIISGRGYSKNTLKWSVIKKYLKNGYKVSPVKSTEDIMNLKILGNSRSVEEYNEYFDNDLIVLDLVGSITNPRLNILSMVEVLEKCGRMNKPLICFSNFSKENILKKASDMGSLFRSSMLTKGKYDEFKVIEYIKEKDESEFSFKENR